MAAPSGPGKSGESLREKAARKSGLARVRALKQIERARTRPHSCFWTLARAFTRKSAALEERREIDVFMLCTSPSGPGSPSTWRGAPAPAAAGNSSFAIS